MSEYKEKVTRFEDSVKELFKSMNNYLDATKNAAEHEAMFYSELKKFFGDPEPVIGGPAETAIAQSIQVTGEVEKLIPLVNNLKVNASRVKADYDQIIQIFKRRFMDGDANAVDDWGIFEEQKGDDISSLFLLLLKLREKRKPPPPKLVQQTRVSILVDHGRSYAQNVLSSLSTLLENKYGVQYFRTFLAKEFSGENIDFWMEVKEFQKLTKTELIHQRAQEIYTSYFSEVAPKQINISGTTAKKLQEGMKNPTADVFNDAFREIFHLMETDSFKRFRNNEMSERLRKRLEHRDFWTPNVMPASPGSIRGSIRSSGERFTRKKTPEFPPSQSSNVTYEPYFKAGWLTKQGGGNGGRKNWKRRWFVVKPTSIEYFEKPQSTEVLGEISFRKYVELQHNIDVDSSKPHGFGIVTADRTYYLIADTAEDREDWMEVAQTLGTLYKMHFALSTRVGETPRAQLVKMVIDPTVNVIYATHSLLANFKKANLDPEAMKDLTEQVTGSVLKYVRTSIAIEAGSTDLMKGLRLSNAKRKLSDATERVKNNKDLKADDIQSNIKAIQEILQKVESNLPNLTDPLTKSLNAISENNKILSETVQKAQSSPDRKHFITLHENQAKLLASLDACHIPSAASSKTTRLLETVKKLVSVELLACAKGARKAFKLVRQNPEQPKYLDEFNESLRFLVSTQNEIDKLLKLLSESIANE